MKHINRICRPLFLVTIWLLVHHVEAQQTMVRRMDPSKTVFVHELGAAVGVSDAGVSFVLVPPAAARPEGTRGVDLEEGDQVLMAAGKRVRTIDDLRAVYEATPSGEQLKLGVRRGDRSFLVAFTRSEEPEGGVHTSGSGGMRVIRIGGDAAANTEVLPGLGVVLSGEQGRVQVAAVLPLPGVPVAGLEEGDLLTVVNGANVSSPAAVREIYDETEVGGELRVTVERGGEALALALSKRALPEGMVLKGAQ